MPIIIGVTDPKFIKGGRKLKMEKHCTIPKTLIEDEKQKASKIRKRVCSVNVVKRDTTRESMKKDAPKQMGKLES